MKNPSQGSSLRHATRAGRSALALSRGLVARVPRSRVAQGLEPSSTYEQGAEGKLARLSCTALTAHTSNCTDSAKLRALSGLAFSSRQLKEATADKLPSFSLTKKTIVHVHSEDFGWLQTKTDHASSKKFKGKILTFATRKIAECAFDAPCLLSHGACFSVVSSSLRVLTGRLHRLYLRYSTVPTHRATNHKLARHLPHFFSFLYFFSIFSLFPFFFLFALCVVKCIQGW